MIKRLFKNKLLSENNPFSKEVLSISAIVMSAITLSACQSTPVSNEHYLSSEQPTMVAQMQATSNSQAHLGNMYLRPVKDGIQVFGKIAGLQPNTTVAIHIHEKGSCLNDGKAAGGHFNPTHKPHGHPDDIQSHAGDMPNVTVDTTGLASYNYVNTDISADKTSLNSVYQRAIIIHEGADDYTSQPSGNAGNRIGCGVIKEY